MSHSSAPVKEWPEPAGEKADEMGKWKKIEVGPRSSYLDNSQISKKYSYMSMKYMEKNPMTRTQWRKHHRNKKVASEAGSASKTIDVKALPDD